MTTTLAAADPMQTVDGGSSPLGFVLAILAIVAGVALLVALGNAVSYLRARTHGGIRVTRRAPMHPRARRAAVRHETARARRARTARRTVLDGELAGPVRTRHGR